MFLGSGCRMLNVAMSATLFPREGTNVVPFRVPTWTCLPLVPLSAVVYPLVPQFSGLNFHAATSCSF